MKKSRISSLSQLRQEKKRLGLMQEVTVREMSHSLGLMRSETKKFALNKIAIPAGVTAATGILLKSLLSSSDANESDKIIVKQRGDGIAKTVMALVPFAMKFMENMREEKAIVTREYPQ